MSNDVATMRPIDEHGDDLDAARVAAEWDALMRRSAVLMRHFKEVSLSLTATRAARELGLNRADALGRWLRQQHLPPFVPFRDGVYVVLLLELHERGAKLARWARQQGHYESVYYRFVLGATGLVWTAVVELGSVRMKARLLREWAAHLGASR